MAGTRSCKNKFTRGLPRVNMIKVALPGEKAFSSLGGPLFMGARPGCGRRPRLSFTVTDEQ